MTELETRCLDAFPSWIGSLAEDSTQLALLLSTESLPDESRRLLAGALCYLFKSLDLIPDGLEGLGYLDDAFVLRVAAKFALAVPGTKGVDMSGALARLAGEASLVAELLGVDHARLEKYVRNLKHGAARGRAVSEIVEDSAARSAFVSEIHGWAKGYVSPGFARDEKNLVKLKSFLGAKLPA